MSPKGALFACRRRARATTHRETRSREAKNLAPVIYKKPRRACHLQTVTSIHHRPHLRQNKNQLSVAYKKRRRAYRLRSMAKERLCDKGPRNQAPDGNRLESRVPTAAKDVVTTHMTKRPKALAVPRRMAHGLGSPV